MVEHVKHAALYVVATPIGNLRDITLRALDILKSVDVVVAEDTRVCSKLLGHYGIDARVIASHEHNERQSAAGIVKLLNEGKSVALTTDAGTPGISDPGAQVIAEVRAAGFDVVPVPGPSALSTALSVAGMRFHRVLFTGFLPSKGVDRRKALEKLANAAATHVLYEAPHRILRTLDDLMLTFGLNARIVVCRELTKLHEEIYSSTLKEAKSRLENNPAHVRGEFVLVIEPEKAEENADSEDAERVLSLLLAELPLKKAVTLTAEITGARKNALYQRALELAGKD